MTETVPFDWDPDVGMFKIGVHHETDLIPVATINGVKTRIGVTPDDMHDIEGVTYPIIRWIWHDDLPVMATLNAFGDTVKPTARAGEELRVMRRRRELCREAAKRDFPAMPGKYFTFQRQTGARLWEARSGQIHDDTGLGKTRSLLNALEDVPPPHLVICPAMAVDVWEREIWAIDPEFAVLKLDGSAAQRRKQIGNAVNRSDFVVISYGSLAAHTGYMQWTSAKDKKGELKYPGKDAPEEGDLSTILWESVTLDEAHHIKEASSIRTRACWRVGDSSKRRYTITATPITQNPMDLWPQFRFVWPEAFRSKTKFMEHHMDWSDSGYAIEVFGWKKEMLAEFNKAMSFRVSKRSWSDPAVIKELGAVADEEMPPQYIDVPMKGEQKKQYDMMVSHLMSVDGDGNLNFASNQLDQLGKLRQLACGVPQYDKDGKLLGLIAPSGKLDAVQEAVESSSVPVLIFSHHKSVTRMIARELMHDHSVTYLTGDDKPQIRKQAIEAFQEGQTKVLCGTMASIGESVDITNAGLLIYTQESWKLLEMIQSRGRVRRIGGKGPCPVLIVRSKGTLEYAISTGVGDKSEHLGEYLGDEGRLTKILTGKEWRGK